MTTSNSSSIYAQDLITSNYIITKTLDAIRNSAEVPALSETSVSGAVGFNLGRRKGDKMDF